MHVLTVGNLEALADHVAAGAALLAEGVLDQAVLAGVLLELDAGLEAVADQVPGQLEAAGLGQVHGALEGDAVNARVLELAAQVHTLLHIIFACQGALSLQLGAGAPAVAQGLGPGPAGQGHQGQGQQHGQTAKNNS